MNSDSTGTIVLDFPTEPGVCAEQNCTSQATDTATDTHWRRRFALCLPHAEAFDAIDRRQRGPSRCSHRIDARDNGVRPPSPPDWCVRPAGHDGDHRMWSTARNA